MGPQRLDDGNAVETRQHAIDDEQIGAALGGGPEAVEPIRRDIQHMAVRAQTRGDMRRGFGIVFYEQDTHEGL